MATFSLSPLGGAGAQFFDNNGLPLAGGLLNTYGAGTTTKQPTFTDNTGSTANPNPIILDSSGRCTEIWLTAGLSYKFVLTTSASVTIWSMDNVETPDTSTLAPLLSPTFTGTPAAPTPSAGDSTTKLATTSFVASGFAKLAGLISQVFSAASLTLPGLSITQGSGVASDVLTTYETGNFNTTFQAGTGVSPTIHYTVIGKCVTLHIPAFTGNTDVAGNLLLQSIPTPLLPSVSQTFAVAIEDNGAAQNLPGRLDIQSNGSIGFEKTLGGSSLTASAVAGLPYDTTITYSLS